MNHQPVKAKKKALIFFSDSEQLSQRPYLKLLWNLSSQKLALMSLAIASVAINIAGGPLLLIGAVAVGITLISFISGQSTDQLLTRLAMFVGGFRVLYGLLALGLGLSILIHGGPSHAIFDGAKGAADSGIGAYIGTKESTSLIDIIIFALWAFVAVGGVATIAGGVIQNVMILVGGITLFFGTAILIGVLEFADGLLFS